MLGSLSLNHAIFIVHNVITLGRVDVMSLFNLRIYGKLLTVNLSEEIMNSNILPELLEMTCTDNEIK